MPESTSTRSIPGILFVVAGALTLARFAAIASSLDVDGTLRFLAPLVLAAALISLAMMETRDQLTRVSLIVAGAGWAVIGLAAAVPALPPGLLFVAQLTIIAALLTAAIGALRTRQYTQNARVALLVGAVVSALYLLSALLGLYGSIAALILVIFAVITAAIGYYLVTRR